jgi:hypothetical protein
VRSSSPMKANWQQPSAVSALALEANFELSQSWHYLFVPNHSRRPWKTWGGRLVDSGRLHSPEDKGTSVFRPACMVARSFHGLS